MKRKIRTRILLNFFSLTVFTVILLTSVGIFFTQSATLDKFFYSTQHLAEELIHNVNNVYKAAKANVEIISQSNNIQNNLNSPDKLKYELTKLKNLLGTYDDITILDPNGKIITSTDYNYTSGWKFSPFFKNTIKTLEPQISNAYYIPQPIRFITTFTAPILDNEGKLKAIVAAQLNMKEINSIVSHLTIGQSGFAMLIDPQSRILYHKDKNQTLKVLDTSIQELISSKQPIETVINNIPMFGASHQENGFSVVVIQAEDEILKEMQSIIFKVILASSFIALFVLSLGIKFSKSLTQPIEKLNESMKRFSKGEEIRNTAIESNDEIGDLALAFDEMTTEVRKFQNELESLVEQRTIELKEAKDTAESANKATKAFLANMSHEIRTPMNAILGFSDILYNQETDEINKNYLSSIKNGGKNLLTLINDVLDMSKIESGNFTLTLKEASIIEIVKDIVMMLDNEASKNNNSLELDLPSNLPESFIMDEIRIRQIITNLVGNAIKFTENGSVKLSVNFEYNEKTKENGSLKIQVIDTGIGISPEDSKNIFGNFIQAKNQGDKLYQGAGLGLAISQKLASLMGANLSVVSELNVGSTFTFHIPFIEVVNYDSNDEESHSNSMLDMICFEQSKILIVDDNKDNLNYFLKVLENKNLNIKTAENGQEAYDLCKTWPAELIIMDLKIPIINGYDCAEKITTESDDYAPIIIASSASLLDKEENPKAKYFKSALLKPVNSNTLINQLTDFLPYSYSNTN